MNKLKLIWDILTGAGGLILFVGLALMFLAAMASEVHADEPGFEWITGTVGDDSVNLIKNQITDEWSWTTGTIGDDSVNLNELSVTDEWDWTSGTIGDDSVNLNSLGIDWGDDPSADLDD